MSFFKLPAELREQVYGHYFITGKGYEYDPAANKLRITDRNRLEENISPIDLSLLHVCRAIYREAKDVPLRVNPVHFFTTSLRDEPASKLALRFERAINQRNDIRAWLLNRCRLCISKAIMDETKKAFLKSSLLLDYLVREPPSNLRVLQSAQEWGHVSPTHHECIMHLLERMYDEPRFQDLAQQALIDGNGTSNPSAILVRNIIFPMTRLESWHIPEMQELLEVEHEQVQKRSMTPRCRVRSLQLLSAYGSCISSRVSKEIPPFCDPKGTVHEQRAFTEPRTWSSTLLDREPNTTH